MKYLITYRWAVIVLLIVLLFVLNMKIGFTHITASGLQSVEVYGTEIIQITNPDDLLVISKIFNKTLYLDTPSCPFDKAHKIILKTKDEVTILYPAIDGCPVFGEKASKKYIDLSSKEYTKLMKILHKNGFKNPSFLDENEF